MTFRSGLVDVVVVRNYRPAGICGAFVVRLPDESRWVSRLGRNNTLRGGRSSTNPPPGGRQFYRVDFFTPSRLITFSEAPIVFDGNSFCFAH
jgi:hypothetical protein